MINTKPSAMAQLSKEEIRLIRHVPLLITLFGAIWTLESLFTWRADSLAESVLSLLASAGATALGLIAWRTRSPVAVLLVSPSSSPGAPRRYGATVSAFSARASAGDRRSISSSRSSSPIS
jgi:hypothetical protein